MAEVIREFKGVHSFLSNFYDGTPFEAYGCSIKTGEHLFNALKTFSSSEANLVLSQPSPSLAKRVGRQVTLRPDWDETERFLAMRKTLGYKFLGNRNMIDKLLDTEDAILIEGNTWHDNVWGDCHCGRPTCQEPGQNHLGKMLMELRDDIRKWC